MSVGVYEIVEKPVGTRPPAVVSSPLHPNHKERILLVDDSRVTRKVFSKYLSQEFDCSEAGSFDEAIAALKADDFAVVITDIIMPGMSGIELLRKVNEDFPNIEVIVVSGVDRSQRALEAIRLGAFDYLIKPCEPAVLMVTIERALERRRLVIDAKRYKIELETRNTELVNRKIEMERLQAQIVQSEKMASLGQLAAGVAHELNNPVGFVSANLELLGRMIPDLVRVIKFYESGGSTEYGSQMKLEIGYPAILEDLTSIVLDCREGSDRIREIVLNLRTFSRLDEAEYNDTDVHEGIDATIRFLSRYFSSGKIVLERQYANLPRIGAFSGPLNQIWMNLLVNAAQSIGSGHGKVTVVTREDDESIIVEIIDTGSGIAVQHLNRIFEPFFTTKEVGEGTGLGLSISYGIAERHGGSITVETKLNEGTIFRVRLPKKFEPAPSPDEKSIACYVAI